MSLPARHSMPPGVKRNGVGAGRQQIRGPRSRGPRHVLPPPPDNLPLPSATDERPMDYQSMKGVFGWTTLDSVSVPYILRNDKQYVSVKMVEQKLLSKFPSTYPKELESRPPLMSQYITQPESRLLNEINLKHCAAEFGKQSFTTQDLVVSLEDFSEFYSLVKSLFTRPKYPIKGGWIQINNTVAPYVLRGRNQSKYLPLSVVRYAAGLLKNPDVKGLSCSEEECSYLASICKSAGLKVVFHLEKTRLIELRLIETLCKSNLVVIELPGRSSPFDYAEYKELEIVPVPMPSASHQGHMKHFPIPPPSMRGVGPPNVTMVGFDLPQPMAAFSDGSCSIPLPPRSMRPTYPPPSAASGAPPKIKTPPYISDLDKLAKMTSIDSRKGSDCAMDLTAPLNIRSTPEGPSVTTNRIPDKGSSSSSSQMPRGDPTHAFVAKVASRMQKLATDKAAKSASSPTPTSSTKFSITPVDFHRKTISCLERVAGDKYALVEAICRVYFPSTPLNDFIHGLENILAVPLGDLDKEEEKTFIKFYALPTNNLKCSKVLKLADLDTHMPQLLYMFRGLIKDSPNIDANKEDRSSPSEAAKLPAPQNGEEGAKNNGELSPMNNNNDDRVTPQPKRPSSDTDMTSARVPQKSRKLESIVNRIYQSRPTN